jgi:putative addiction module component (TIGR02574 family)
LLEFRAVKDLSELLELLPDDLAEELDRRLAAYRADPSTARPWTEVRAELLDPDLAN